VVDSIQNHVREIEEQSFELSTLYSMLDKLTRTIDERELRAVILHVISDTIDAVDRVVLAFRLDDSANLGLYTYDVSDELVNEHCLHSDRIRESSDFIPSELVSEWLGGNSRDIRSADDDSAILVPLESNDRSLGVLFVRKANGHGFTGSETHLLHALRTHIAISLENARLYSVAVTDELTRVFTLRYFHKSVELEMSSYLRYGQQLSLLMLDLDDFKRINDTYGHPTGDVALQRFARVVQESVRAPDIVCRYGGEEFAVIMPSTDRRAAAAVAERIRAKLEAEQFPLEHGTFSMTESIGIASCSDAVATVRELVGLADRALYDAKKGGKNIGVVAPPPYSYR
jgi:diguanylate cyclase (GGDEF)-like protein